MADFPDLDTSQYLKDKPPLSATDDQNSSVLIDDLLVSVLYSSVADYTYDVTRQVVGEAILTDNRSAQPYIVSLSCVLVDDYDDDGNLISSWTDKRDKLDRIRNLNKIISVITPDRYFSSVMLTSVTELRNDAKDAYFFSVSFAEVKIINRDEFILTTKMNEKLEKLFNGTRSGRRKKPNKPKGNTSTTKITDEQLKQIIIDSGVPNVIL